MNRFAPALALIGLVALLLASRQTADATELLVNGGFESGTTGWSWSGQIVLETVPSPVRSGLSAARASGDSFAPTQVVQQRVAVQPGSTYQFSGWILSDDPNIALVAIRIAWYTDSDSPISFVQQLELLEGQNPSFRPVSTARVTAPPNSDYAQLQVKVQASGAFAVYLDDFSFDGPLVTPPPSAVPSPTTTPIPTLAPTPAPTTTNATTPPATIEPIPTSPPPPIPPPLVTPTKAPTPAPAPTPGFALPPAPPPSPTPVPGDPPPSAPAPTSSASATPQPTESPAIEPSVFAQLTNGGFEQTRDDGSPYAWRKFGGTAEVVTNHSYRGSASVRFLSNTTSTKWVHQVVAVNAGAYYEASGYALKNDPDVRDVFLRVSFYSNDDGLGSAIATADSLEALSDDDPNFRRLSTGPVQTPPDARTARLRLMLRPSSNAPAEAYFDGMSFVRVSEPIDVLTNPPPFPSTTGHTAAVTPTETNSLVGGAGGAGDRAGSETGETPVEPMALAANSTPARLANVGLPSAPTETDSPNIGRDDNGWFIALALALPAIGLATVGVRELHRTITRKQ